MPVKPENAFNLMRAMAAVIPDLAATAEIAHAICRPCWAPDGSRAPAVNFGERGRGSVVHALVPWTSIRRRGHDFRKELSK